MNSPSPVASDPTTPGPRGAPTALGAATATGIAGAPLSLATVWVLETYGTAHGKPLKLDSYTAAALGSVGSALIGYLWQVLQGIISAWLAKNGAVVKSVFIAAVAPGVLALCVLGTVGGLSACASGPNATEQTAIAVAVDLATGFAIEQGTNIQSVKVARATNFEAIAKQLQTLNQAGNLTLPTLAADLGPAIAKLPPADQLAANALVAALTPWVNQQLSNPKVANAQATIAIFLSAVIQACAVYTGS